MANHSQPSRLRIPDPRTVYQIAAVADLSLRTVERYYLGLPIRPRSLARIRVALADLHLPEQDPTEAANDGRRA